MNIEKDGKTLYFSDEEIDNNSDGEKRVFVTKRINGKESHIKIDKNKKNVGKHFKQEKEAKIEEQDEVFNFNNEIVIGVNSIEDKENKKEKNKKRKNKKQNKNKFSKKEKNHKNSKGKRKKIKFNKIIIAITTTIVLIVIVVILALTAPLFNIVKINVEGNEIVSNETILNLSGLKKGENIFKFNKSVISNIKENRYIQDVKLKRKLPGTVLISVKERKVKYQLNLINSYVYIDKNGYILENSNTKADVPIITGLSITEDEMINNDRLEEKDIERLSRVSKIIDSAKTIDIENLITEINIEDENNYILYLESENKKIYIGDTTNLTNKMLYIKKILENEKQHSGSAFVNGDISAGFKPYFREE